MNAKIIVHCKGNNMKELLSMLEDLGYKWNGDNAKPTSLENIVGNYVYIFDNEYGKVLQYGTNCPNCDYIEFSNIETLKALLNG